MTMIEINRHPTKRQLRQFGFIWLGFLTLFGFVALSVLENSGLARLLWAVAVVVPLVGWFVPAFMRLVFVGMSHIAWPVGFIVSHVLLAAVYYLLLTPIGLAMRLFGYDPMGRLLDRESTSYWMERPCRPADSRRYFRQF
jgi:hypothetical protein